MAEHTEGQMKYIIKAYEPKVFEADNEDELQVIVKSLIRQNYTNISVEKGDEE